MDENDVEKIIDLATDYGIDINEDIDSVDFYENRIEELKGKIEHFSKTVVMQWWNMNESDRKKYERIHLSRFYEMVKNTYLYDTGPIWELVILILKVIFIIYMQNYGGIIHECCR